MDARRDDGFTLVELLVTLTLLAFVMGMAYASFNHALSAYRQDATQLSLSRSLRMGLAGITRDLTNAMVDTGDENFQFLFEDMPGLVQGEGQDIVTFVTTVAPNTESTTSSASSDLPPSLSITSGNRSSEVEAESQAATDLVRVAYFIGPNPDDILNPTLTAADDETQTQSLVRVVTPTLSLEEAFGNVLGQDPATMIGILAEEGAQVESAVDNARALDMAFFDGEEWWTTWNVEEQGVPSAARAVLTVQDPLNEASAYTRSATARISVTEAPEVEAAGGGQNQGGNQQQGGPQGGPGG